MHTLHINEDKICHVVLSVKKNIKRGKEDEKSQKQGWNFWQESQRGPLIR